MQDSDASSEELNSRCNKLKGTLSHPYYRYYPYYLPLFLRPISHCTHIHITALTTSLIFIVSIPIQPLLGMLDDATQKLVRLQEVGELALLIGLQVLWDVRTVIAYFDNCRLLWTVMVVKASGVIRVIQVTEIQVP